MSGRWRGCAPSSLLWVSSASKANASPKTTRRSCAKLWPVSSRASSPRRWSASTTSSTAIWRHGCRASSPISKRRRRRTFIARSVRSGGFSSTSKPKHSRSLDRGTRRENAVMKAQDKATVGRRSFFRLIGTGAAAGAMAPLGREAAADGEKEDEKRKARYRESDEVKTYYRVNRYPK